MNIYNIDNFIFRGMVAIVLLAWFLVPTSASAYFSSSASAEGNNFSAGTLILDVSTTDTNAEITATSSDAVSFTVDNTGSVAEQYQLVASKQTCRTGFFDNISVSVDRGGVIYDGDLSSLQATTTLSGVWEIEFSAKATLVSPKNESCTVELEINTWQDVFTDDAQGGFSDQDSFTVTLTTTKDVGQQPTASVVLNEIYPAELATTTVPLEREWIELYNGTGSSVDVTGFVIGEQITSGEKYHTIVDDCSGYPVSEYMQPYGTSNTVIPAGGLLVVEFCGGSSYLNNTGDTVALYQATSSPALDSYTYNSVPNGKSIARIPDGSDWVDPIPTPGTPNTATVEELQEAGWSDARISAVLGTETVVSPASEEEFIFMSDVPVIQEDGLEEDVSTTTASTTDNVDPLILGVSSTTHATEKETVENATSTNDQVGHDTDGSMDVINNEIVESGDGDLSTTTATGTPAIDTGNNDEDGGSTNKEEEDLDELPIIKEDEITTDGATKEEDSGEKGEDDSNEDEVGSAEAEEKGTDTKESDAPLTKEEIDAIKENTEDEDQEGSEPASEETPPEKEIDEPKEVKKEAVAEDPVEDVSEPADEAISNEEKS